MLTLQEYSFSVQHQDGVGNPADAPSRFPITSAVDVTGARLDEEGCVQQVVPKVVFATEEARQAAIREFVEGSSVAGVQGVAAALAASAGCEQAYQPHAAVAAACYTRCALVQQSSAPVAAAVVKLVFTADDLDLDDEEDDGCSSSAVMVAAAARLAPTVASAPQSPLASWARRAVEACPPPAPAALHECARFYQQLPQGVVLVELFGGLCAGLEACLRNGIAVRQYVYCDRDQQVQLVARHRLAYLQGVYPQLLPVSAVAGALELWPQDVREIEPRHVHQLRELGGAVMLWAGWECQDLSAAGSGRGLQGRRSSTFFPLHDVLGQLRTQLGGSFAYVLENTAMDVPWQRSTVVRQDYRHLVQLLGEPLQLDAAQFGSRAHRLRLYWTNLAPVQLLQPVLQRTQRDQALTVQQILDPGRRCRGVEVDDAPPFFCCNVAGQQRRALPTLMATVGSYAFRGEGPGTLWDAHLQQVVEPNPDERERALGYATGCTAAPGVSQLVRHQVTGRCMDSNVIAAIVAVAQAIALQGGYPSSDVELRECSATASVQCEPAQDSWGGCQRALQMAAAAAVADDQEAGPRKDIWMDPAAIQWLQDGEHAEGLTRSERNRVIHRVRHYLWRSGQLVRRMPDGSHRTVPRPEDRAPLIQRLHEQTGHYGVRRTAHMVMSGHWWHSLQADVAKVLRKCGVCDRVRASWGALQPQLQPLPVEPMFYRWGFDLAGDFPVTARGHRWVLIAVEYFSKHIELVPLRDKSSAETSAAATQVFCRFGAPAEVVTDGGGEWQGQYHDLLVNCFVDHRVTSPFHPQANGLAERVVQVVKRSLQKLCEANSTTQWDLQLPWVALGYRCSKQSSTGMSPYELLYARPPVFPSSVQDRMQEALDFDDPAAASASLMRRALWLEERMPIAAGNLKIAQHRDTLRYSQLRGQGYLPKVADFRPGDFVYLKRPNRGSSLVIKARPSILKIKSVSQSGAVVLQDRAGVEFSQHVSQLAPCHLPDIDGTVDRALRREDLAAECEVCQRTGDEARVLYCDGCNKGWHTYCCDPPLESIPEGLFICIRCRASGLTEESLEERELVRQRLLAQPGVPNLFPLAQQARRDERAAQLHGRLVTRSCGRNGALWGRVCYKGALARPGYFKILFADGSVEDDVTHRRVTTGKGWTLKPEGAAPPRGVRVPKAVHVPVQ